MSLHDRLVVMPEEERQYLLGNLPSHLADIKQLDRLGDILTNYDFLQSKLDCIGIEALIRDYDKTNSTDMILIRSALEISRIILNEDHTQLASQLMGRLINQRHHTAVCRLLDSVAPRYNWIIPLRSNLIQAGGPIKHIIESSGCVMFSPDGNMVSIGHIDIELWDTRTGILIKVFKGHTGSIHKIRFNSRGTRIVSSSTDRTIRVWDIENGTAIRVIKISEKDTYETDIAFSSDGLQVVSVSKQWVGFCFDIWDIDSCNHSQQKKYIWELFPAGNIWCIVCAGILAVLGLILHVPILGYIALFLLPLPLVVQFDAWISRRVTISPNGQVTAISFNDNIGIYNTFSGRRIQIIKSASSTIIRKIVFSRDTQHIVCVSWLFSRQVRTNPSIEVWNIQTGEETLSHYYSSSNGGRGFRLLMSLAISPDGSKLAISSLDEVIIIVSKNSVYTLSGQGERISSIEFSSDSQKLVSSSDSKTILWDHLYDKPHSTKPLYDHRGSIRCIAFSPDGKLIVSGSGSKDTTLLISDTIANLPPYYSDLCIWDVDSCEIIHYIEGDNISTIKHVSFDHSGRYFVVVLTEIQTQYINIDQGLTPTGVHHDEIRSFDSNTGERIFISKPSKTVVKAMFSSDDKYIMSISSNGKTQFWNITTGKQERNIEYRDAVIGELSEDSRSTLLSPDAQYIARISGNKLSISRAEGDEQVAMFHGDAPFCCLAWSPNISRRIIALGDEMGRVLFLDYMGGIGTKEDSV